MNESRDKKISFEEKKERSEQKRKQMNDIYNGKKKTNERIKKEGRVRFTEKK